MRYSECNVGGWDRDARLAIGLASAALAFAASRGPVRVSAAVLSAIGLGTALGGYCPVNQLLGIDTCRGDESFFRRS